jgi:hypothetical protein
VIVPFGDYQCIAIPHRIESGREVNDFESRSSRQTNHFASAGLVLTLEVYRFRTVDNHRMNPVLLALLREPVERPFIQFAHVGLQPTLYHHQWHSPVDAGATGNSLYNLPVIRRRLDAQAQSPAKMSEKKLLVGCSNGKNYGIGFKLKALLL